MFIKAVGLYDHDKGLDESWRGKTLRDAREKKADYRHLLGILQLKPQHSICPWQAPKLQLLLAVTWIVMHIVLLPLVCLDNVLRTK